MALPTPFTAPHDALLPAIFAALAPALPPESNAFGVLISSLSVRLKNPPFAAFLAITSASNDFPPAFNLLHKEPLAFFIPLPTASAPVPSRNSGAIFATRFP